MSCETCIQVKPIPVCISEIVIGTIADINTDVLIKLKNVSNGRIIFLSSSSDGAGLIALDVSEIKLTTSHYEISVHDTDDVSILHDITIGGESSDCIDIPFEFCNDIFDSVTLTLKD